MRPQPQTYAERLRGTMSWALLGAGIVCTGFAVGALLIAWRGGWPAGTEHQRLSIVGWALLGALAGMLAVIISLAIGGPVGRFKANVGRAGVGLEAEDHDLPPAATVTTTTVVNPAASAAPPQTEEKRT
ncbi:hypothetical protein LZK98_11615 [Sphingomonas cannabina]|uniref:hypothetical protein n=1 Tax=Sphingomonas cannabina TaxID=2899123 RepID=UPI001F213229|nr:hypothetical protein [Sphingomonas cannabina]UIJ43738.1 hypothetical protein LZK98_11615 [Sphingomonas cannabina]